MFLTQAPILNCKAFSCLRQICRHWKHFSGLFITVYRRLRRKILLSELCFYSRNFKFARSRVFFPSVTYNSQFQNIYIYLFISTLLFSLEFILSTLATEELKMYKIKMELTCRLMDEVISRISPALIKTFQDRYELKESVIRSRLRTKKNLYLFFLQIFISIWTRRSILCSDCMTEYVLL